MATLGTALVAGPWASPAADPWQVADPWTAGLVELRGGGRNAPQTMPAPHAIAPEAHNNPSSPAAASENAWQGYRQGAGCRAQGEHNYVTGPGNGAYWYPSRGGSGTNGYARRVKHTDRGERFEVINWQGIEVVPVQKDFSFEHPAVSARSEEECEEIRANNSIHVIKSYGNEAPPKPFTSFEEAPFPDWVAAELRRNGFGKPTAIQVQAWPILLKGYDFVGISETGSGKTIAYVLPMLVHLMAQPELRPGEGPIGLVLVPTRELCLQVVQQVKDFTAQTSIVCQALYGGEDISFQARQLARRMDIAVSTPGRLIALLNNRATNLRRATFVVLDEADELLNKNLGDQVRLVLGQVRPDRQALLFSATWPPAVERLAATICNQKAIHVNVGSVKMSACKTITQRFKKIKDGMLKNELLFKALDQIKHELHLGKRALVFCNCRDTVDPLVEDLKKKGYQCEAFHGQMEQSAREQTLHRFSDPTSDLWLLVCTQILGRGHDFHDVHFVINFDMPPKVVEYIHRIGRTGRSGNLGYSLTFITDRDLHLARELVMVLRQTQQEVPDYLAAAAKRARKNPALNNSQMRWSKPFNATDQQPQDVTVSHVAAPCRPAQSKPWGGRGRAGLPRQNWLSQCRGCGPARAAPEGLEPRLEEEGDAPPAPGP